MEFDYKKEHDAYKQAYENLGAFYERLVEANTKLVERLEAVEHTLVVDGATVCRVVKHVFVDGVCAECGVAETRPATKA